MELQIKQCIISNQRCNRPLVLWNYCSWEQRKSNTWHAYRRAGVQKARIKYAADDNTKADKSTADTSDQTDGFGEDYLDMNSLTQQVIDDYNQKLKKMRADAKKSKDKSAGQPVKGVASDANAR